MWVPSARNCDAASHKNRVLKTSELVFTGREAPGESWSPLGLDVPAAAGVSQHGRSWIHGPGLQFLHLLQERLLHSATCAVGADDRHQALSECFALAAPRVKRQVLKGVDTELM